MLNVEMVKSLLHGCVMWTAHQTLFGQLRTVHHNMLLRVIGSHRTARTITIVSYHDVVEFAGCEHIQVTVPCRRLLWNAVIRVPTKRLYDESCSAI